jgi:hypothetical protein
MLILPTVPKPLCRDFKFRLRTVPSQQEYSIWAQQSLEPEPAAAATLLLMSSQLLSVPELSTPRSFYAPSPQAPLPALAQQNS